VGRLNTNKRGSHGGAGCLSILGGARVKTRTGKKDNPSGREGRETFKNVAKQNRDRR